MGNKTWQSAGVSPNTDSLQAVNPEAEPGFTAFVFPGQAEPTSVRSTGWLRTDKLAEMSFAGTVHQQTDPLGSAGGVTSLEALPCRHVDPELFFAESPVDVEYAKALCLECPLQQVCLEGALERREPWGVWGGQLFVQGVVVARKRPRGRPREHPLPDQPMPQREQPAALATSAAAATRREEAA